MHHDQVEEVEAQTRHWEQEVGLAVLVGPAVLVGLMVLMVPQRLRQDA